MRRRLFVLFAAAAGAVYCWSAISAQQQLDVQQLLPRQNAVSAATRAGSTLAPVPVTTLSVAPTLLAAKPLPLPLLPLPQNDSPPAQEIDLYKPNHEPKDHEPATANRPVGRQVQLGVVIPYSNTRKNAIRHTILHESFTSVWRALREAVSTQPDLSVHVVLVNDHSERIFDTTPFLDSSHPKLTVETIMSGHKTVAAVPSTEETRIPAEIDTPSLAKALSAGLDHLQQLRYTLFCTVDSDVLVAKHWIKTMQTVHRQYCERTSKACIVTGYNSGSKSRNTKKNQIFMLGGQQSACRALNGTGEKIQVPRLNSCRATCPRGRAGLCSCSTCEGSFARPTGNRYMPGKRGNVAQKTIAAGVNYFFDQATYLEVISPALNRSLAMGHGEQSYFWDRGVQDLMRERGEPGFFATVPSTVQHIGFHGTTPSSIALRNTSCND